MCECGRNWIKSRQSNNNPAGENGPLTCFYVCFLYFDIQTLHTAIISFSYHLIENSSSFICEIVFSLFLVSLPWSVTGAFYFKQHKMTCKTKVVKEIEGLPSLRKIYKNIKKYMYRIFLNSSKNCHIIFILKLF